MGELAPVETWLVPGDKLLELGCGTGRLTRRLLERGMLVTAVDNSEDILAEAPVAATKVCCDIASLDLNERFTVVLVASCLINHPGTTNREAILRTSRRHLVTGGVVLLERHDPEWLTVAEVGIQGTFEGVTLSVDSAYRTGDQVDLSLSYTMGESVWRHTFIAAILHKREVEAMLSREGFASPAWFGAKDRWVAAFAT